MFTMSSLEIKRKAAILSPLCEGNSIASTCRNTGAAKNTVIKLLLKVGEAPRLLTSCYCPVMPTRSSNDRNFNVVAFSIVQTATGDAPPDERVKNPAAVALGRLGGTKGGAARAKGLTPTQRSDIGKTVKQKARGWDELRESYPNKNSFARSW